MKTDSTLKYIEGRMDEDTFYNTVLVSAGKSLLIIIAILGATWVVYDKIIPSTIGGGSLGLVALTIIITCFAFYYVFKPKTILDKLVWMAFAAFYASIMYLGGQFIVVAILFLGLYLAITAIIGEISFTGIFTYRDLRKWVEHDKQVQKLNEHVE